MRLGACINPTEDLDCPCKCNMISLTEPLLLCAIFLCDAVQLISESYVGTSRGTTSNSTKMFTTQHQMQPATTIAAEAVHDRIGYLPG